MAFIEREYKVGVAEIDQKAVCSKKAMLKFFESIACDHSDLAGYGITTMETTRKSWVLLQWKVKIYAYPIYGQTVKVKTWARDTDAFTTYRDFILTDARGKIYANATSKWVLINIDKGLTKIGDIIEKAYQPETDSVFENRKLDKLSACDNPEFVFDYTVMPHDIDVNRHMHNLNYLHLAEDALYECDLSKYKTLEIFYKTQAKLGDTLSVFKGDEKTGKCVVINNGEKLSAIVKFYN